MAATMHDLLTIMIERGASDLHVTTGTYPQIRLNGRLVGLNQFEQLTPQDTQRLAYSVLNEGRSRSSRRRTSSTCPSGSRASPASAATCTVSGARWPRPSA